MAEEQQDDKGLLAKNLREVLSIVKERGPIEIRVDDDLYVVAQKSELLPEQARDFLLKGGPAT